MVFLNDFVAAVKSNGKILRENHNEVYLPFGSEYSILLKNLRTVKALTSIWIDGREVIKDLICEPNSDLELERFFETDRKFRFIEKTNDIKNYRGDKIDDGIIRITYQFEKPEMWGTYFTTYNPTYWYSDTSNDIEYLRGIDNISCNSSNYYSTVLPNDQGITAEGSKSYQNFTEGYIGVLEPNKHTITIKLFGLNENNTKITKPLTVDTRKKCKYCGRKWKSSFKYCSNCGAYLI